MASLKERWLLSVLLGRESLTEEKQHEYFTWLTSPLQHLSQNLS